MAYIANMPDGQLPEWLSANRLMLWTLLALSELGGRAHLDVLYRRLGEVLRIPEDLLWLEYPPEARQEDYVVRHRMGFALTDLGFLGLVNSHGQGNWSLSDEGADFLKPLDEEDAPMAERDWSRETGIELTPVEMLLSNKLMEAHGADVSRALGSVVRTRLERPDDWPEEPFRSRGAPHVLPSTKKTCEGSKRSPPSWRKRSPPRTRNSLRGPRVSRRSAACWPLTPR